MQAVELNMSRDAVEENQNHRCSFDRLLAEDYNAIVVLVVLRPTESPCDPQGAGRDTR